MHSPRSHRGSDRMVEPLGHRMTALIPYFQIPILEWGPVVLDSWTALVLTGFVIGLEITRARAIRLGLEVKDIVDGAVVTVGMGFFVGHVVHVLAYNPQQLTDDGIMAILRVWAGFSSTGGFIGAVIGSVLFYRVMRKREYWIHADTIMFGFPFAWVFGRLGCFSAHDHIGRLSDFWLAVQFPSGSRHDLGLYEALWTMGIAGLFYLWRNKPVKPGFFLALFSATYAPIRFVMDFLRNDDMSGADVRWLGLTPAQYGMVVLTLVGVILLTKTAGAESEEE
jgi:phosphatidylglycerol:prolipoprotein diacylglycerol transferase